MRDPHQIIESYSTWLLSREVVLEARRLRYHGEALQVLDTDAIDAEIWAHRRTMERWFDLIEEPETVEQDIWARLQTWIGGILHGLIESCRSHNQLRPNITRPAGQAPTHRPTNHTNRSPVINYRSQIGLPTFMQKR